MDIDLKQGLGELADDAPTSHLDPDLLWRSGVRRRNRRRVGTAAAAVTVIALVAGAVGVAATPGLLRDQDAPTATSMTATALPDRVWMPSPWTPGTDRAGDPGRIAVMFWDNGRRKSSGGADGGGFVSVSAVDGRYRYLDLPDLVLDGANAPVLSPDGRYVAYTLRSAGPDDPAAVSTGWAVYDAQTGEVARHRPSDTPKGVGDGAAVWTPDSRTLLLDVCRITQVSRSSQSCTTTRTDVWDLGSGDTREVTGPLASEVVGRSGDDLLVRGRKADQIGVLDVRSGRAEPRGTIGDLPDEADRWVGLNPGDDVATVAAAAVEDAQGSFEQRRVSVTRVAVATGRRVGEPGEAVGPLQQADLLDVRDDGQVVGLLADVGGSPRVALVDGSTVVDVSVFEDGWGGALPSVALDLLDVPTTAGVRPPYIADPRAVSGGVALGLAAVGGLGLLWWRRRRFRGVTA